MADLKRSVRSGSSLVVTGKCLFGLSQRSLKLKDSFFSRYPKVSENVRQLHNVAFDLELP